MAGSAGRGASSGSAASWLQWRRSCGPPVSGRVDRDDVAWPDPEDHRDLRLGEPRRDRAPEKPDRASGVLRCQTIQMLACARLCDVDDAAADLQVTKRLARVEAQQGDSGVAPHVLVLD